MYSDKALRIDLKTCTIYDADNFPSEYWGIYRTVINDKDVYYIYNKCTLCIVYYIIPDKPIADVKNAPRIRDFYSTTMDNIAYKDNKYAFSLYVNDYGGYALIHVNYDTETGTLIEEYKGAKSFYPHGIQTYKNSIPKLDAQGKLKLTLGNTCAFTLIENKVLREIES